MKLKEIPASLARRIRLARLAPADLNDVRRPSAPVIVSFTSIPQRLGAVHWTVRSVLAQSRAPEKLVLWLTRSVEPDIPESLRRLQGGRFEMRFVDGTSPHRKLVHCLDAFPDRVVVTCDDDLMYPPDWLESLYQDHVTHPRDVVAYECRRISHDAAGALRPYRDWPGEPRRGVSYPALMSVGYAGVVYPPGVLHKDATDSSLYLRLAPRADDLWFKAMALLKGTQTRTASRPMSRPIPTRLSQKDSLKTVNVKQDGNRLQWQALVQHFGIRLEDEG